jgi:hypothetical protein
MLINSKLNSYATMYNMSFTLQMNKLNKTKQLDFDSQILETRSVLTADHRPRGQRIKNTASRTVDGRKGRRQGGRVT